MIRVLVCDDDKAFLQMLCNTVEKELKDLQISSRLFSFSDPDEISDVILKMSDIAILDIDFQGNAFNGIQLAQKLRAVRNDSVIIFVTNYIEYAPEGYEVRALRYILKKDIVTKIPECLQTAVNQLESRKDHLQVKINGEIIDIRLSSIVYIESELRMVVIHVQNGRTQKQYKCYAAISDLENQLQDKGFLRIHKSYIVNMRNIGKFQCHELRLTDGTTLPVSAKNYADQKKKYLLWKGL